MQKKTGRKSAQAAKAFSLMEEQMKGKYVPFPVSQSVGASQGSFSVSLLLLINRINRHGLYT